MRKLPRSLRFYVAASTLYAATVFFAVQFIYTFQLTQSGLLVAQRDSGDVLSSIQIVSFIVWLGISLIAAAVMHRLATARVADQVQEALLELLAAHAHEHRFPGLVARLA